MNGKVLGHRVMGCGPSKTILLHDWIGDSTTWNPILPFLDTAQMSWALLDLRGYGRSRKIAGDFTLDEAVADVLATARSLGWDRFSIIGHSMSSLVAMSMARVATKNIERIVLAAPCPPQGTGADMQTVQFLRSLRGGDPEQATEGLNALWGNRLSGQWAIHKAQRWLEATDAKAAAAYVDMFAHQSLPDFQGKLSVPVLAITGDQDAPFMRSGAVLQYYAPLCAKLEIVPIKSAGHYPMQEAPPLTYTLIERFLAGAAPAP